MLPESVRAFDRDLSIAYRETYMELLYPLEPDTAVEPGFRDRVSLRGLDNPADDTATDTPGGRHQYALYLFNVLVALEWTPNEDYLKQLRWAFRRASALLSDATNGFMAFGQVVIGGPDHMASADIQILASSRLHPRVWVGGLHEDRKYMPIRLGRGIWHTRNKVSVPWSEPEGYRVLVHEWLHYALFLKDDYLHTISAHLAGKDVKLVVPKHLHATDSLMEDLRASEADVYHVNQSTETKLQTHFPYIKELPPRSVPGPYDLVLPLPEFYSQPMPQAMEDPMAIGRSPAELHVRLPGHLGLVNFEPDKCWVYVVRTSGDNFKQLIPQGTLDWVRATGLTMQRRSAAGPNFQVVLPQTPLSSIAEDAEQFLGDEKQFRVFGAQKDDFIVLMDARWGQPPTMYRGEVEGDFWVNWKKPKTLTQLPTVAVRADVTFVPQRETVELAQIRIKVTGDGIKSVWVFPLGEPFQDGEQYARQIEWSEEGSEISKPIPVPTLDGHVLVELEDGAWMIYTFSQGGTPPSQTPIGDSPVTAGSSDGSLMLFFCEPDGATIQQDRYKYLKILTTTAQGEMGELPNAIPGSYIYTLTSTEPIPSHLTPTLVLFYEGLQGDEDTDDYSRPTLYHWNSTKGQWQRLDTYGSPHLPFVAVPLNERTACNLIKADYAGERTECYRLFWELVREANSPEVPQDDC